MCLHRGHAHEEGVDDLDVGQPAPDGECDLALPFGQVIKPVSRLRALAGSGLAGGRRDKLLGNRGRERAMTATASTPSLAPRRSRLSRRRRGLVGSQSVSQWIVRSMWKGGPILDQPVLYLQLQLPHPTATALATPPPEWVTSPHGNTTTTVLNRRPFHDVLAGSSRLVSPTVDLRRRDGCSSREGPHWNHGSRQE